jgi:transcriptional regulator with XRE-family HTH domain
MSRRYLSGIERGEANPSLDQVVRLAVGLGVEVRELMPCLRAR